MMRPSGIRRPALDNRRGVVLIVVLGCIAVIALLLGGIMKASMQWSRQSRYESWKTQADCLAESGLRRAATKLSGDESYEGEVWELSEADGLTWPATVEIKIESSPKRTIDVKVAYAKGSGRIVRSTRRVTLNAAEEQDD